MSSAASYIHRKKLLAEARETKVQYPGGISESMNPIYSTTNCNPDFTQLTYVINCDCRSKKIK